MVEQLEGLLKGERLLPSQIVQFIDAKAEGKGLNVKTLLDDPPPSLNEKKLREEGIDAKYLEPEKGKKAFDVNALFAVWRLFDAPLGVAYMAWFN
jgi:hypothetical protein